MKKRIRLAVDIAMTVLMPMLMAYSLIGESFHEVYRDNGVVLDGRLSDDIDLETGREKTDRRIRWR